MLGSRVPQNPPSLPSDLCKVVTPLRGAEWAESLTEHPDKEFVAFLLGGIEGGFRIGFDYANCQCRGATRNMASAEENPEVVSRYRPSSVLSLVCIS